MALDNAFYFSIPLVPASGSGHGMVKSSPLGIRRFVKNPYTILYSSYCKSIGILENELLADKRWAGKIDHKLFGFPDFADTELPEVEPPLIKNVLAKANGRKIIGNLGAITKRKAIINLFETALSDGGKDYFFLFAGQLVLESFTSGEKDIVLKYLYNTPENCFVFAERIPEESVFNGLVRISSVLTLLYGDFPFSSNLLAKAANFQKLVIGSKDAECIRRRVEEFKLGLLISDCRPETIIESLHILNAQYNSLQQNARFQDYLAIHSAKQIPQSLRSMLRFD